MIIDGADMQRFLTFNFCMKSGLIILIKSPKFISDETHKDFKQKVGKNVLRY